MSLYGAAPASTPGKCSCCHTKYDRGAPIAWDTSVRAWVLAAHLSAAARR